MGTRLAPYSVPSPVRSALLKNPPEAIPPTDELEALHAELALLKQKSLEKVEKACEDLKILEESMRRMKEKEKGKAKAVEKIKRERDFTPLPELDDMRPLASSSKSRLSSHPLTSVAPSSSRSSLDPRNASEDKKKKKKRKRDLEDSDVEMVEPQRARKATPPVAHSHPLPNSHLPPPKAIKSISSSSQSYSKTGPDFSVPQNYPLLPPRPPIPPPPIPGPSKPSEVTEDFSKLKPPTQTSVTTFYSSIEPYLRFLREEDLGFLEYTGDEVEPFVMPRLGRHYLEVWEEQDRLGIPPVPGGSGEASTSTSPFAAPVPKWDPSTLSEPDLLVEEKGHGPLTERLISALLPMENNTWKGVKAAEDAMEGRPGGSGAAASRKEKMNVSDLEVRIRDTMRFHGLLDGIPDYSDKVDDPIATALRQAQSELRTVCATNKARKARYAAIARDRLGYQEYLELRDSIDRNITNTFSRLQKKDAPKLGKKKKKGVDNAVNGDVNGNGSGGSVSGAGAEGGGPLPPCPAALGLGPDEENRLVVSEQLRQLVETRRKWVDDIGGFFDQKESENPGRIWGFPKESIFAGIEEEVRELAMQQSQLSQSGKGEVRGEVMLNGNQNHVKGKEKAREIKGEEMDVG